MNELSVEYDLAEADVLQLIEHHHRVSPTSRGLRAITVALAAVAGGAASYVAGQGWKSVL